MAGTTTNYSLPYPESTDLVASYPALGQDLAEDLDTILAAKLDASAIRAYVSTSQSTTSTSYTDLSTAGPAVTITTGTRALVIVSANIRNSGSAYTYMSFGVSGATTVAPSDDRAVGNYTNQGATLASRVFLSVGLTPGSNTFTSKYRVSANTGYFQDRQIIVLDMGS